MHEGPGTAPVHSRHDALADFASVVTVIRWGTTAVAIALAASDLRGDTGLALGAAALLTLTVVRTLAPLRFHDGPASLVAVLAEVAVTAVVVAATGFWDSPLALALLAPVSVAGFARGFAFGLRVAAAASAAVSAAWVLEGSFERADARTVVQWTVETLLVALVAGYARRISGEASRRQTLALDRLGRLSDANALLFRLHHVAQTLPESLDLQEALDTSLQELRQVIDADALAVLLHDDVDGLWHLVRRQGAGARAPMTTDDLPAPLARALRLRSTVTEPDLTARGGPGLAEGAGSGLYGVLAARGSVIGMVVAEHRDPHHFDQRDVELVEGYGEPAALAIDNARWFARLRTVGADEERTRIARDLHDRIGQSLAFLAFELDRLVKLDRDGKDTGPHLEQLRAEVRDVMREVRDTLHDLRTDVTEQQGVAATLARYLERVGARSGLEVTLDADESGRLPLQQERELWRITQEAVTNVERHSDARRLRVSWRCDGHRARVEVADDGRGFVPGRSGRPDSFGIVGMRERAASIGAGLTIRSEPDRGTVVGVEIGPAP